MEQKIDVMIDEAAVEARIAEIAQQLSKEYEGKTIHIIGVLKGSVFFMCELAKRLTVPVTMDFMSVSSYGNDTKSSGVVKMIKDLDESIEGRDVVLIEDIMDSGRTLSYLINILKERKPASFKVVTLLDKPDRRVVDLEPDITGFAIPDRFVVGYGLDCAQNLPDSVLCNVLWHYLVHEQKFKDRRRLYDRRFSGRSIRGSDRFRRNLSE